MGGWTLSFVLFALVSFIPGLYNGYIAGGVALLAEVILFIVGKNKKEAAGA
jgi:type IV secretory pathway TrbL component